MKKLTTILLVLLAVNSSMGQRSKRIAPSDICTETIIIDGSTSEWPHPLKFFDKTFGLSFSLCNDSTNLFLVFRITNSLIQRKILRTGIIIGLDTLGTKKIHCRISYPINSGNRNNNQNRNQNADFNLIKNEFRMQPHLMELEGFINNNGQQYTQSLNGIAVSLNWENDDMIYELKIPLNSFDKSPSTLFSEKKVLALTVIIPAIESPQVQGGSGFGSGGGRPGGAPGGGRPSGGGPPSWVTQNSNNADFQVLQQEQKLRHRFYLILSK